MTDRKTEKKRFAQNLQNNRKRLGYTQAHVAKQIGVTPNTYANWEYQIAEPSISKLIRLAECFEVTLDDLIGKNSWRMLDSKPKQTPTTDETEVRVYGKLKHSDFNEIAQYKKGHFIIDHVDVTQYVLAWMPIPQNPPL